MSVRQAFRCAEAGGEIAADDAVRVGACLISRRCDSDPVFAAASRARTNIDGVPPFG